MLQDRPICFNCQKPIESNDFVFEAPCGHPECPSVVMHPICLMEWRDEREAMMQQLQKMLNEMMPPEMFLDDD